jgi:hypothetical protein
MKSLAALIRAVVLAAVTLGILALATPALASPHPAAAPSPKTAKRGGSGAPGNLSDTGPRQTVIELTLLGGAVTLAARKSRITRP